MDDRASGGERDHVLLLKSPAGERAPAEVAERGVELGHPARRGGVTVGRDRRSYARFMYSSKSSGCSKVSLSGRRLVFAAERGG